MGKEIAICLIVIIAVITGDIITQNNTNKIVEDMKINLNSLREELQGELINKQKTMQKLEQTENAWEEKYETMAYYIEHDELEKVETELTKLKADIEVEEYTMAVENLDSCAFILEHIKDKNALKIVNLF